MKYYFQEQIYNECTLSKIPFTSRFTKNQQMEYVIWIQN